VKIEALAKPQILSLQTKPVSIDIPRAGLHKIQIKKTATLRKVSGKERRRIERMKERVLQRRVANKFMKGNVPYVVPLDTKNF
jgi:hypothetical protein